MSNDLESDVRRVLHATTTGVAGRPDEAGVAKRVTARRRRRRLMAVGSGVAATACVVVGLVIIAGRDDADPVVPAATPTTAATAPAVAETSLPSETLDPAMCEPPSTVPFIPANPPAGWTIGPLSPVAHVAAWSVPNGMIEVWNGIRDDLPVPDRVDKTISVLGQEAGIGPISDGYSVVVELGPTRCEVWAIVGHPSVTEADLQAAAEGLTLIPAG